MLPAGTQCRSTSTYPIHFHLAPPSPNPPHAGSTRCGSRGGGLGGPPPPPDPPFWGPNVCRHRDYAVRCRQNLGWAPPLTQILDPHLGTHDSLERCKLMFYLFSPESIWYGFQLWIQDICKGVEVGARSETYLGHKIGSGSPTPPPGSGQGYSLGTVIWIVNKIALWIKWTFELII